MGRAPKMLWCFVLGCSPPLLLAAFLGSEVLWAKESAVAVGCPWPLDPAGVHFPAFGHPQDSSVPWATDEEDFLFNAPVSRLWPLLWARESALLCVKREASTHVFKCKRLHWVTKKTWVRGILTNLLFLTSLPFFCVWKNPGQLGNEMKALTPHCSLERDIKIIDKLTVGGTA